MAFLTRIKCAIREKRFEDAYKDSQHLVEIESNNFQAWLCFANASFYLSKFEESEKGYDRAAAIEPDVPLAWKGLIELFEKTQNYSKIIVPLERLSNITLSKGNVTRSLNLISQAATAAELASDFSKAIDLWVKLAESDRMKKDQNVLDIPPLECIWIKIVRLKIKTSTTVQDEDFKELFNYCSQKQWKEPLQDLSLAIDHYIKSVSAMIVKATEKKKELVTKLFHSSMDILKWYPYAASLLKYVLNMHEFFDSENRESEDVLLIKNNLVTYFPQLSISLVISAENLIEKNINDALETVESLQSLPKDLFSWSVIVEIHYLLASISHHHAKKTLESISQLREVLSEHMRLYGLELLPFRYSEYSLARKEVKALYILKKYSEAMEILQSIFSQCSKDTESLIYMAEIYIIENQLSEATNLTEIVQTADRNGDNFLSCRGWISYLTGDIESAKTLLEESVGVNADNSLSLYRLGRIYWFLGGIYQTEKNYCIAKLLQAAKLDQTNSKVFTYLGHWYNIIKCDTIKAIKCYRKALSIDGCDEEAGSSITTLYKQQNQLTLLKALCEDITKMFDHAKWAWLFLGQYQLAQKDYDNSVISYQNALDVDETDSITWSCLAHAYHAQGKYLASLRAFTKSLELGNTSPSLLCELSQIECDLGQYEESKCHLDMLLSGSDNHLLGLKIYCNVLFGEAKLFCNEGRYGRALESLIQSVKKCRNCLKLRSASIYLWKLLGDMYCFAFHIASSCFSDIDVENLEPMELDDGLFSVFPGTKKQVDFISQASLAYNKIIELTPTSSKAYYDLGVSYLYRLWLLKSTIGASSSGLVNPHQMLSICKDLSWRALDCFRSALRLDPFDALSWNALGVVETRFLVQQYAFIRAIELQRSAAAWGNLAMLYLQYQKYSLAREAILGLQAVNPSSPVIWIGFGLLYEQIHGNDSQENRIAAFSCATQLESHLDAQIGYAYAVYNTPNYDQAAFCLSKYVEKDQGNSSAFNLSGIIYCKKGLYKKAVESFNRSINLLNYIKESKLLENSNVNEVIQGVYYNLAKCNLMMGNYEDALNYFKMCESNRKSMLGVALVYYRLQNYSKVSTAFDVALNQSQEMHDTESYRRFLLLLAKVAYKNGNKKEAAVLLHQCATKYPECCETAQCMVAFAALSANEKMKEAAFARLSNLESNFSLKTVLLRSWCYQMNSDWIALRCYLKNNIANFPDEPALLNYMGYLEMLNQDDTYDCCHEALCYSNRLRQVSELNPIRQLRLLSVLQLVLSIDKLGGSLRGTFAAGRYVCLVPTDTMGWIILGCNHLRIAIVQQNKDRLAAVHRILLHVKQKIDYQNESYLWICHILLSFVELLLNNENNNAKENAAIAVCSISDEKLKYYGELQEARCYTFQSPKMSINLCKNLLNTGRDHFISQVLVELAISFRETAMVKCENRVWEYSFQTASTSSDKYFLGLRQINSLFTDKNYKLIPEIYKTMQRLKEYIDPAAELIVGLSLFKMKVFKQFSKNIENARDYHSLNIVQNALKYLKDNPMSN